MKWIISIILVMIAVINIYADTTIFTDDFINTNYISVRSNIIITNSNAVLSSIKSNGILYSVVITKSTNETWHYFNVSYEITNSGSTPPPLPKITFDIYDANNTVLISGIINTSHDISSITSGKIKIRANFSPGIGGNTGTPLLKNWSLTVSVKQDSDEDIIPDIEGKFYGAPAPFKISDSTIRFYYSITEDSYVTLEIYDANYFLVKTVEDDKKYSVGDSLDAVWDGKNGEGISVYSGLYVAKLIIKDSNKNIKSTSMFPFAIIR